MRTDERVKCGRMDEGLPKMQRAPQCPSMRLIKTVEIYCDFCCEDPVFSKVCFDNVL